MPCSPGFETDNRTGATSCTACDAGKFSTNATAWQCLPCAEGRSSTSGQPECDSCEAGRFQALSGQGSCETCSVGKVAPASGSMVCSECEPGKAQRASGQEQCEKCAEGKFSGAEGSSACEPCGIEYDSKEGSEVCDIAASGHYLEKPIGTSDILTSLFSTRFFRTKLYIPVFHMYNQSPKVSFSPKRIYFITIMFAPLYAYV